MLRRKWTFRTRQRQVVFVKKANEHATHVLLKAFLWALYLPAYPDLLVEVATGDRYKPDVVALDPFGQPRFWGEAGQISPQKIRSLARRYRHTHFAIAKWDMPLAPLTTIVTESLASLSRSAPFDLLNFPPDSAERFIDRRGRINLTHNDVEWVSVR